MGQEATKPFVCADGFRNDVDLKTQERKLGGKREKKIYQSAP